MYREIEKERNITERGKLDHIRDWERNSDRNSLSRNTL